MNSFFIHTIAIFSFTYEICALRFSGQASKGWNVNNPQYPILETSLAGPATGWIYMDPSIVNDPNYALDAVIHINGINSIPNDQDVTILHIVTYTGYTVAKIDKHLTDSGYNALAGAGVYLQFVTDSVAAIGDPHVSNSKGERFDIRQEGSVPLLAITRIEKQMNTDLCLKVIGYVKRFRDTQTADHGCRAMYFTEFEMTGPWLQDNVIRIERPVNATIGGGTFSVMVEGKNMYSEDAKNGSVLLKKEADNFHTHEFSVEAFSNRRLKHGVTFHIKGLTLTIYEKQRFNPPFNFYLNIKVQGLQDTAVDEQVRIGGVLGVDGHDEWIIEQPDCKAQKSLFKPEQATDQNQAGRSFQSEIVLE